MGLLDETLGSSWDDPRTMALMQLTGGLLGRGGGMQRLATGMQGYTGVMGNEKRYQDKLALDRDEAKRRNELIQAQMEKLRADAERMKLHPWKDPAIPSAIQLYEYTQKLTPEQRTQFVFNVAPISLR
jgi:hypothetical protein